MSKFLSPEDSNQKREKLYEILPLTGGPLCVRIMVTNVCNFKCFYCRQAESDTEKQKLGLDHSSLSYDAFCSCIDHLTGFEQLKVFNFTGGGEPLMHKDIARMVSYVKQKNLAKQIEITTNGSLLTREMSDALLAAGLDRIKISLQGLSSAAYFETCGVRVDYEQLKERLHYFYQNRGHAQVFVKIIDTMVPTMAQRQAFIAEYSDFVDEYEIECLYPTPAAKESEEVAYDSTLYGNVIQQYVVCPQPFYSVTIFPNGYAYPCCLLPNPAPLCNAVTEDVAVYWHGTQHKELLLRLLHGEREQIPVCSDCYLYSYVSAPNDNLDAYAPALAEKYLKL